MVSRIIEFVTRDIWRIRLKNYSPAQSFLIKQLRIIILAIRGYAEDKCKFRASALTFFSILSIVPVVAMFFGIAKGFGMQEKVQAQIEARFAGQEKVAEYIVEFANKLLESTQGGIVAGIGIAFLFWTIIKVLGNIESSFNDIWGVKKSRHFGRKFSDYLSMMLVCPVLLVISSSLTVAISSQINKTLEAYPFFQAIGPVVAVLLWILPYCTLWIVFSFVFIFMPNTKVRFSSGVLAGVVAGTTLQLAQWGFFSFIIGLTKYNAVYGTFAALPMFFIWFQMSWLIVLFGAELAFAHQNVDTYEFEQDCLSVSYSYKRLLTLLIVQQIVKNFCQAKESLNASDISHMLEIPIRLVRQILFELVEADVVAEVKTQEKGDVLYYHPARDVEALSVKFVIDALEEKGNTVIPVIKSPELKTLSGCLARIDDSIQKSSANVLLKDI
ncbi:MAG: YihY/virulence factor BrkB family protein [Planctomycetes bacterium]|nr:YihY/virulence factor BrkB family protein [Planctomycetota bacterium]